MLITLAHAIFEQIVNNLPKHPNMSALRLVSDGGVINLICVS